MFLDYSVVISTVNKGTSSSVVLSQKPTDQRRLAIFSHSSHLFCTRRGSGWHAHQLYPHPVKARLTEQGPAQAPTRPYFFFPQLATPPHFHKRLEGHQMPHSRVSVLQFRYWHAGAKTTSALQHSAACARQRWKLGDIAAATHFRTLQSRRRRSITLQVVAVSVQGFIV